MQITDRQMQWLMIGVAVGMLVFGFYVFMDDRRCRERGTGRWATATEVADAQELENVERLRATCDAGGGD